MKKLTLTIILLFSILFNANVLRCQETCNASSLKYQTAYAERTTNDVDEDNVVDDKNVRVRILEWIIKHNITKKYQRIEEDELMDMIEVGR
jgi:hypothetical protein